MPAFLIDPKTGERVGSSPSAVQIDPATGERMQAAPQLPPVPGIAAPQGLTGPPSTNYAGMALKAGNFVKDFDTGVLKGVGSTANNLGHIFYPDFVAKHFTGAPTPQQQDNYFAPSNTSQAVGKGIEQAGEFLVPGGAEEAGAAKLASALPKLGKAAAPVARLATGALSSGLVNKAQGGSFAGGAAAGAAGGAVSEGLKVAAPVLAESALGVRATDRAYGRTPGQAIIQDTSGVNPGKIADQAKAKVSLWGTEHDNLLSAADRSGSMVDLTPPRLIASDAAQQATLRNNGETIKRVGQLNDQLNTQFGTASAIPPSVPPTRANALKQGVSDLKGSWNPNTANDFANAANGRVYHSLDEGLEAAAPGQRAINQNISSMLPVSARAGATDLNASTLQRVMGRWGRPTGALAGGLFGAGAGYKEGGAKGALTGATIGLVAPEVMASPTTQMLMARGFNSATPAVRALSGAALLPPKIKRKGLYDQQ